MKVFVLHYVYVVNLAVYGGSLARRVCDPATYFGMACCLPTYDGGTVLHLAHENYRASAPHHSLWNYCTVTTSQGPTQLQRAMCCEEA
jgi:hypothetical protein